MKIKYLLDEEEIPKKWYNVAADMPTPLDPPLHPWDTEAPQSPGHGAYLSQSTHPAGDERRSLDRHP